MGNLTFEWTEGADLVDRLRATFTRVSIRRIPNVGIVALTLWQDDAHGLQIGSKMHDLGPRQEAGVLAFQSVIAADSGDESVAAPLVLGAAHEVSKLVGSHGGHTTESGIVFEAAGVPELIVAAGVFPHTLAVSGLDSEDRFDPELDLEDYARMPISPS